MWAISTSTNNKSNIQGMRYCNRFKRELITRVAVSVGSVTHNRVIGVYYTQLRPEILTIFQTQTCIFCPLNNRIEITAVFLVRQVCANVNYNKILVTSLQFLGNLGFFRRHPEFYEAYWGGVYLKILSKTNFLRYLAEIRNERTGTYNLYQTLLLNKLRIFND